MNNEMDIILSRYFSGEATKKELRAVNNWLSGSRENENYFQEMSLLYRYAGQIPPLQNIDIEKALSKFKIYIYKRQKHRLFVKRSYIFNAAAAVALLLIAGIASFYFLRQSSEIVQFAATEMQNEFNISENVNVTLFSGSEISYNKKKNNAMQLNGKAVFYISSNNISNKIIVQAGETYIEDIGTIFTVDASHLSKFITVEVDEGEVKFYTKSDTGIRLKSNEKAMYDVLTKQFIVGTGRAASEELIFQNTPLQDAINIIKVRYDVNILIHSSELKDIPLNASFDKNESIENVLDIIAETVSAHLSKKDDVYVITAGVQK